MSTSAALLIWLAASTAIQATRVHPDEGQATAPHPLLTLPHSSGWIPLGVLDTRSSKWSTVLKFKFAQSRPAKERVVPARGDILEITASISVAIVDYGITGDANYLSPIPERPLTQVDQTPVVLTPSTRVQVVDVVRHSPVGRAQAVWVRVIPVVEED